MANLTKIAIANAFKELIQKRSVSEITINDLTSYCGLNRQTFYYHFQDIYDLIEWIFIDDSDKVVGLHKTINNWQEGYLALFNYCLENKKLVTYTYNSVSRKILINFLYKVAFNFLKNVADDLAKNMNIREENKNFVINFYKYVFVGLITEWIDNNMLENPKNIINKLNQLIAGEMKENLERFNYHGTKN